MDNEVLCDFQYMQIAENVLAKLPSSMLMPETRHQIRETRIDAATEQEESVDEHVEKIDEMARAEEDLV